MDAASIKRMRDAATIVLAFLDSKFYLSDFGGLSCARETVSDFERALTELREALHVDGSVACVDASWNDLGRGRSDANGVGGTSAPAASKNSLKADFADRANLLEFVRSRSAREVTRLLGLGLGTVCRLRCGQWPKEGSKILKAWAAYKAIDQRPVSSWFLRRVRSHQMDAGLGLVRHGRLDYTCPALRARVGELLAVARGHDGTLVAQTLQAPVERLVLASLPLAQGGVA